MRPSPMNPIFICFNSLVRARGQGRTTSRSVYGRVNWQFEPKRGRGPARAGPDHPSLVGSPYPAVRSWQSSSKSNDRRKTVVMYRRTAILVAATVVGVPIAGAVAQNGPGGTAAARHAGVDIEAHRGGRPPRPGQPVPFLAHALAVGLDTVGPDMG